MGGWDAGPVGPARRRDGAGRRLWDLEVGGREVLCQEGHSRAVYAIAFQVGGAVCVRARLPGRRPTMSPPQRLSPLTRVFAGWAGGGRGGGRWGRGDGAVDGPPPRPRDAFPLERSRGWRS